MSKDKRNNKRTSKNVASKVLNGRPTVLDDDLIDRFFNWLLSGKSVKTFCAQPGNPDASQIYRWIVFGDENEKDKHPENHDKYAHFRNTYMRARALQAHVFVDEMVDIADYCDENSGAVSKAMARISARKIASERLAPRVYGPKAVIEEEIREELKLAEDTLMILKNSGLTVSIEE